jgi:hypothetical protein
LRYFQSDPVIGKTLKTSNSRKLNVSIIYLSVYLFVSFIFSVRGLIMFVHTHTHTAFLLVDADRPSEDDEFVLVELPEDSADKET